MAEQPRPFIKDILDTRPNMYSDASEQTSPTIAEKAKLEGNKPLRDFIILYNSVSESSIEPSEKITKLQALLDQVEQAKLTREGREAFGETDGDNTSTIDFVPLIQMIDGELKTLQEQTVATKAEVNVESRTQVEQDIESLEESLTKTQDEINEALSTLDPTYLRDLKTIDLIFSKLESVGEKIRRAIDQSSSSAVAKTEQEMKINEILSRVKSLKEEFKKKWAENARKIYPELSAFYTAVETLHTRSVTESPTVMLVAARDEYRAVLGSINGLSIPDEYKEILRTEIASLFEQVKKQKLQDWKKWLLLPGKNGTKVNQLIAKYEPYLVDGSVLEITDAIIAEAQTPVDQARIVYSDLKKVLEEQIEYWNNEYQLKAEDVLKRLKEKKESTNKEASSPENGVESTDGIVTSPERVSVVERIRSKIAEIESREKVVIIEADSDVLGETIDPLYQQLEELRGGISPELYAAVEREVMFFDYRYTKRVLNNKLQNDEENGSNKAFYFSEAYNQRFTGSRGFGRLEDVAKKIKNTEGESDLFKAIEVDRKRFEEEIKLRRTIFYAEQDLEPKIIGAGDASASASRSIPQQAPEIFPDMGQMRDTVVLTNEREILIREPLEDFDVLRYPNERLYNRRMTPRTETLVNIANPDDPDPESRYVEIEGFVPTAHGDAMRLIDMLYNDKLASRVEQVIRSRDGLGKNDELPEGEEKKFVNHLRGYFRSLHITTYKYGLPAVIQKASKYIYEYEEGTELTEIEIKQAWYAHALLLNQSMLIPGSSPKMDDRIYKANQWLNYVVTGVETGTTPASLFHTLCLYRSYDPSRAAAGGRNYTLDSLGLGKGRLKEGHNITEKMGNLFSGVREEVGSLRDKVIEALKEAHLYHDFSFLADLPLTVVHKTPWGTLPVIPLPLQYMIFSDPTGKKYTPEKIKVDGVFRDNPNHRKEERVKRWNVRDADVIPHPVTAADYVNERGDIMYELIPWDEVLPSTALEQWYNNGKNFEALYTIYSEHSTSDMFNFKALAKMQNDQKYAASGMPGHWGEEVSAGRFDATRVFQRVTIVSVFARSIELLASNGVKSLHDLEHQLIGVMSLLGEKEKGREAVEAIMIVLKQILGPEEESQEYAKQLIDQFKNLFKYSGH